jgi:hypothetical protein
MAQLINEAKRFQKLANIKESQLNESLTLLGAFALASALTAGKGWLIKKKKEIADAEKEKEGKKRDAETEAEIKAEKEAIEAATQALSKTEYQDTLRQIQSDPDIKNWTKEIDTEMEKQWDHWEKSGGNSSYGMGYHPPYWGSGKEDLLQKIEDKIKTFERGTELLGLLSKSGKNLGNIKINPKESLDIDTIVNEALAKVRKSK